MVGGDGRRDLSKNSQLNFALNLKPGLEYAAVFWVQLYSGCSCILGAAAFCGAARLLPQKEGKAIVGFFF